MNKLKYKGFLNLTNLNEISIRRSNLIVSKPEFVVNTPQKRDIQKVWAFIKSLNEMGYTLDKDSTKDLLSMTTLRALFTMKTTLGTIVELTGNKNFKVFYENFPEKVLNTSSDDLYFNSFLHYVFGFLPEDTEEREEYVRQLDPDLFTKTDYKVLKFTTRKYYVDLLKNLVSTKVAPSESDKQDILTLIEGLTDAEVTTALDTEIPFKEVLSMVIGKLHVQQRLDKVDTSKIIKTATDLLRVIAYINNGEAVITAHMNFKFKNSDRRFILNSLESLTNPIEDLLRNKLVWRDIAKLVHAKKSTHPKTFGYFDYVFDKKKYVTFNSTVDPLLLAYKAELKDETLLALLEKLETRPSELGRRLDSLVRYAETKVELNNHFRMITTSFGKVASEMNSRVLYQIRDHFLNRAEQEVPRMVQVKGTTVLLEKAASLNSDKVNKIVSIVDEALIAQYVYKEPLGKVYIDERLSKYALTTSERTSSKANLNPLTVGTRIPLVENENSDTLRTFVFWKNIDDSNKEDSENITPEQAANYYDEYRNSVDIDSSAVFLNSDFEVVTECSYYNLKAHDTRKEMMPKEYAETVIAVHSGDITNAPNGAAEYVDVNIARAKTAGIRYVTFNINSFTSQTLKEIGTVRSGFMWMDSKDTMKGKIYNERFVQASTDITAESTNSLVMAIDLETMEMIWIDTPVVSIKTLNNVASTEKYDTPIVKKYALQKFTSLTDLYTLHAKARASEIVTNKEDADVVFEIPSLETPLNISDIVANWV